jgi:hypothetical protein
MYGSAYRITCQINEIGLCIKYGMLGINPNKLTSKYAVAGYAPKITSLAINRHITFCMDNKLK